MPATSISYIGATISCVASKPATLDDTGFGALTYVPIGEVVSIGEIGDTSEDITLKLLSGRVEHVNGALDGGSVPISIKSDVADAGQILLTANNNANVELSFEIVDPDGAIAYFFAKVANFRDTARDASTYKGQTGELRVNSLTVRS